MTITQGAITTLKPPAAHGPLLLAGDVGGTKTDLAIYALADGPRQPLLSVRVLNDAYTGLDALVGAFLHQQPLVIAYACFAVAGPVIAGRVKLTNLPWELDEGALAAALGLRRVWLLNDLLALATAVPYLVDDDLHPLNPGTPVLGGTIAVIAPGTGLGEAFLTWDGTRYHAYPSEGGHASFGPINQTQLDLLVYLRQRFDHVSYEQVCSGIGMPNIYTFFRDAQHMLEAPAVAAQLARLPDHAQAQAIIEAALALPTPDPLCAATLETFISILGAETGNLTLKVLSTGGVYLAGGIPLHVLPALATDTFMQAATSTGRFAELIARIPIHVITYPQVALLGAAGHGLERARAALPPGQ